MSSIKTVDDKLVESKFNDAKATQDSIQLIALWMLNHKSQCEQIVNIWLNVLKQSKLQKRLTLFYICNEIVQTCKRKHAIIFKDCFKEVLRDAALLVRDKTVKENIERIFKIWAERTIYDVEFVDELLSILHNAKVQPLSSKILSEFKPSLLREKLSNIIQLEKDLEIKKCKLTSSNFDVTSQHFTKYFKDRQHGKLYAQQIEDSHSFLTDYLNCINKSMVDRVSLIDHLECSLLFYEAQYGEAKIVANAYRNFGVRVKNLQKKLEEIRKTLPAPISPIPSPTLDAPSPSESVDNGITDNIETVDMDLSDEEATNQVAVENDANKGFNSKNALLESFQNHDAYLKTYSKDGSPISPSTSLKSFDFEDNHKMLNNIKSNSEENLISKEIDINNDNLYQNNDKNINKEENLSSFNACFNPLNILNKLLKSSIDSHISTKGDVSLVPQTMSINREITKSNLIATDRDNILETLANQTFKFANNNILAKLISQISADIKSKEEIVNEKSCESFEKYPLNIDGSSNNFSEFSSFIPKSNLNNEDSIKNDNIDDGDKSTYCNQSHNSEEPFKTEDKNKILEIDKINYSDTPNINTSNILIETKSTNINVPIVNILSKVPELKPDMFEMLKTIINTANSKPNIEQMKNNSDEKSEQREKKKNTNVIEYSHMADKNYLNNNNFVTRFELSSTDHKQYSEDKFKIAQEDKEKFKFENRLPLDSSLGPNFEIQVKPPPMPPLNILRQPWMIQQSYSEEKKVGDYNLPIKQNDNISQFSYNNSNEAKFSPNLDNYHNFQKISNESTYYCRNEYNSPTANWTDKEHPHSTFHKDKLFNMAPPPPPPLALEHYLDSSKDKNVEVNNDEIDTAHDMNQQKNSPIAFKGLLTSPKVFLNMLKNKSNLNDNEKFDQTDNINNHSISSSFIPINSSYNMQDSTICQSNSTLYNTNNNFKSSNLFNQDRYNNNNKVSVNSALNFNNPIATSLNNFDDSDYNSFGYEEGGIKDDELQDNYEGLNNIDSANYPTEINQLNYNSNNELGHNYIGITNNLNENFPPINRGNLFRNNRPLLENPRIIPLEPNERSLRPTNFFPTIRHFWPINNRPSRAPNFDNYNRF